MSDKPEGRRRQVTVLFADMAGYTPLAETLGEEKTFELMRPVIRRMIEAVESHRGTVQDLSGDGVMAVFGAPAALEDAPLRACRAALAMQDGIAELAGGLQADYGVRPSLRIGIHTGPVVVGEMGGPRAEARAVGDTVNLASRLESAAEPGTVLISEATQKLVEGHVESAFAGERRLKGKAEPQRVYRLAGVKPGVSRFEAVAGRGLTRMVEREAELDMLNRCWQETCEGTIRVANVVGEAGIGKSRVIHEFRERLRASPAAFLRGYCAADGRSTPFLPFIEVIRRAYRIGHERDPEVVQRKLRSGLEIVGLPAERHLPYLANLLGVRVGDALDKVDDEAIGVRTRETLQTILREQCRVSPVVLFIDDLHWVDSASEAYLLWMARANEAMPLLVLCTYRPEYRPPWAGRANVTELALGRLSDAGAAAMLKHRIGAEQLPVQLTASLVEKTGGNPLFVEEMANYLVETGRLWKSDSGITYLADETDTGLPATLENLLMQRVDRLSEVSRQALKVASVIGGWFVPELASEVAGLNGGVGQSLDDLAREDLLFVEASESTISYRIKHALIGDAVYHSVLSGEREALHLAVAEAIERAYGGREGEAADVLAHHYSRTPHVGKTMRYLYLAGQKSLRIYSIEEAHARFRQVLDLVEDNPGVADQAFTGDLILALARVYWLFGDVASTIQTVEPHLQVVEALGDKRRLSRCLFELGVAHWYAAHPAIARPLLERALALAEEIDDASAIGYAAEGLASYHVWWGQPGPEQRKTVRCLGEKAYELGTRTGDSFLAGQGLNALAYLALLDGNPREQRKQSRRMLELSRMADDSFARQLALLILSHVDLYNHAPDDAIDKCDEALRLALAPNIRIYVNPAKGSALAFARRAEEAYDLLRETRQEVVDKGHFFALAAIDYHYGVAQVLRGEIAKGVSWIEKSMRCFEDWGLHPTIVALGDLTLGEIYLGMVLGEERPALAAILRNAGFLVRTLPFAAAKARRHLAKAASRLQAHGNRSLRAWSLMDLGLLAKSRNRAAEARGYFDEARALAESVDAFAIAEKSKAALAELSQVGNATRH